MRPMPGERKREGEGNVPPWAERSKCIVLFDPPKRGGTARLDYQLRLVQLACNRLPQYAV